MSRLFPDQYYDSVFEIPYQALYAQNIRGLIFDVDNTLAPCDAAHPPAKVVTLIRRLQKMGFQVSLLSNNTGNRLTRFNEHLQLVNIHYALKPLTIGAKRAMTAMGTTGETTAIIGDQVFTDVLCGKRAKLLTILVKPISRREGLGVRLKRLLEKPILSAYHKQAKRDAP